MTDKIILQLIQLNIIDKDDEDIYRFGIEGMMLKVIHYISYTVIAISFRILPQFILFFLSFTVLRKHAGGYHAQTKKCCYVFSCLTVTLIAVGIKYLPEWHGHIKLALVMTFVMFANLVIYKLAPTGNRNRLLDLEEISYFRARTMRWLCAENLIIVILLFMKMEVLIIPILLGMVCEAALLILEKCRNTKVSTVNETTI